MQGNSSSTTITTTTTAATMSSKVDTSSMIKRDIPETERLSLGRGEIEKDQ